jgi:hypothetical protein
MFEDKSKKQETKQDPKESLHNSLPTEAQRIGPGVSGSENKKPGHEYDLSKEQITPKSGDQFRQEYLTKDRLKEK